MQIWMSQNVCWKSWIHFATTAKVKLHQVIVNYQFMKYSAAVFGAKWFIDRPTECVLKWARMSVCLVLYAYFLFLETKTTKNIWKRSSFPFSAKTVLKNFENISLVLPPKRVASENLHQNGFQRQTAKQSCVLQKTKAEIENERDTYITQKLILQRVVLLACALVPVLLMHIPFRTFHILIHPSIVPPPEARTSDSWGDQARALTAPWWSLNRWKKWDELIMEASQM